MPVHSYLQGVPHRMNKLFRNYLILFVKLILAATNISCHNQGHMKDLQTGVSRIRLRYACNIIKLFSSLK